MQSGQVEFEEALDVLMVPIDSVQPHPQNYNNGDVDGIMESILESGMYRPIYVNRDTGQIVAGNHTWMACKELESEVIPVVWLTSDELTAKKRMIADNEYAKRARPDNGLLLELLEQLQNEDTLVGTSFTSAEVEQLRVLAEMPLTPESEHQSWPTLCFQVQPHIKKAFYELTEMAMGDNERFQLMVKMCGGR